MKITERDYLEIDFPNNSETASWNYLIKLYQSETVLIQLFYSERFLSKKGSISSVLICWLKTRDSFSLCFELLLILPSSGLSAIAHHFTCFIKNVWWLLTLSWFFWHSFFVLDDSIMTYRVPDNLDKYRARHWRKDHRNTLWGSVHILKKIQPVLIYLAHWRRCPAMDNKLVQPELLLRLAFCLFINTATFWLKTKNKHARILRDAKRNYV